MTGTWWVTQNEWPQPACSYLKKGSYIQDSKVARPVAHAMSHSADKMPLMKAVEFWLWMMKNSRGRVRQSPCRFMEKEAVQYDPQATRIPGTCEVRELPETPDELDALHTSSFLRKGELR